MRWIVTIAGLIGIVFGAVILFLNPESLVIAIALILLSGAIALEGGTRIGGIKKPNSTWSTWIVVIVGLIGIILGALSLFLSPQSVLIGIPVILISGAFGADGWRRISATKKGNEISKH